MKPQSRRFSFCRSLFPIALVVLAAVRAGAADRHAKKLIEFGWDEPDTGFMRAHISEMQRTPFDGCVFHADYAKTNGARGSFTWEAWGQQAFTPAELAQRLKRFSPACVRHCSRRMSMFGSTRKRHAGGPKKGR